MHNGKHKMARQRALFLLVDMNLGNGSYLLNHDTDRSKHIEPRRVGWSYIDRAIKQRLQWLGKRLKVHKRTRDKLQT